MSWTITKANNGNKAEMGVFDSMLDENVIACSILILVPRTNSL